MAHTATSTDAIETLIGLMPGAEFSLRGRRYSLGAPFGRTYGADARGEYVRGVHAFRQGEPGSMAKATRLTVRPGDRLDVA